MKRLIFISGVVISLLLITGLRQEISGKDKTLSVRSIEFTENINVPVPKGSKNVQIWIPMPATDFFQRTELLTVKSSCSYRLVKDENFGNQLLYFERKSRVKESNIDIKVVYKIIRTEQSEIYPNHDTTTTQTSFLVSSYLQPRGLEIINEKIKIISEETTKGMNDPLQKAKALYEYVLKHMRYDKSGTGWGRGDSVYACDIGKGNCTDFHSLFITLARASQIPARFQMGIPLPKEVQGRPSGAYHCWAEFYIEGKGWIPVDISEAWKQPDKTDYYFGAVDENRILISTGREIGLPYQKGSALNYLDRAYAEADGKPLENIQIKRSYKNQKG